MKQEKKTRGYMVHVHLFAHTQRGYEKNRLSKFSTT